MRFTGKRCRILFALLLILVGALPWFYVSQIMDTDHGGEMAALRRMVESSVRLKKSKDTFTIVMQTYNRTNILLKLLKHYQAVPDLKQIVIVWNNIGQQPPRQMWDSLGPHPVTVFFKEQTVNRVRNRMMPVPEIDTEAVLMLDDDLLISVPDVNLAFSAWKQFPDQIVGFVPRKHVTTAPGVYSYSYSKASGGDRYSMVLVGASFFHHRYLQLYQDQPSQVHTLVDKLQNCDDLAMNFVVAAWLEKQDGMNARPSGVVVKPVSMRRVEPVDAKNGFVGLWHRPGHMPQRSYCLNQLAKIHGHMPLRFSNITVTQSGIHKI